MTASLNCSLGSKRLSDPTRCVSGKGYLYLKENDSYKGAWSIYLIVKVQVCGIWADVLAR